jgi:hypothetical protein
MSSNQWAIEHSATAAADLAFTWAYMTDVKNWDDPPAKFTLNGSFSNGSLGSTEIPGQAPLQWQLREVKTQQSYTIEIALERAAILCMWVFAKVSDSQTQLTQSITLSGESASSYRDEVQQAFGPGLVPGMNRIATAIGHAYTRNQLP